MNRSEHLQWCKDRAIPYFAKGEKAQGMASFVSDMGKHEETKDHLALRFIMGEMVSGRDMTEFINGFN